MVFRVDTLITFIQQYGYIAFFLLAFFETTAVPIPSEVVLPFAGAIIALNALNPFILVADVWIGNLSGNIFGYLLAYFLGIDVVLKYGRKFGFKMDSYVEGEKWIKRYGVYFAFITEILPVIRSVTSIICGAFKMDFKKFVLFVFAGFVIWSSVLMYLGYLLAGNWQSIINDLVNYSTYIGILSVVALVIILRRGMAKWIKWAYRKIRKGE
jgi:membrane protein DedA with SNARE-associated domain